MSHLDPQPPEQPEFDFWDYVSCSRCHLHFTPESGGPPPIPFWVTECAHVVCNNHLKADHSCPKCGSQNVQVAPLQREMQQPMSDWFMSVPHAVDTLAFTTRLQIESLASLVRHYKRKSSHYRGLVERMKPLVQDNKDMRRALEELQAENDQLRGTAEHSDALNYNGKRPRVAVQMHASGARTNSSPRSVVTPIAPERLTIPPNHRQPNFASRQHHSDDGLQFHQQPANDHGVFERDMPRPGSRRLTEQYAYIPPQARQGKPIATANLSYSQTEPVQQAQERRYFQQSQRPEAHIPTQSQVTSDGGRGFRPAQPQPTRQLQTFAQEDAIQMPPPPPPPPPPSQAMHNTSSRGQPQQRMNFQVPSTPRGSQAGPSLNRRLLSATPVPTASAPMDGFASRQSTGGFRAASATPVLQTQRFMPSTPSRSQRFNSSSVLASGSSGVMSDAHGGNNANFRASSHASGGQRLPFVPPGPSG